MIISDKRYFKLTKLAENEEELQVSENSPLATYTRISPNRTSPRVHVIDTITVHCIVGQWTAKQGCDYFAQPSAKAAPNYVVGKDGSIGLCVEERDRAWTTGGNLKANGYTGKMNDHRAVTIEVASDTQHPYAVTDQAYAALIELVTDICRRNGIKKLLWKGDRNLVGKIDQQNMTVHRWFANKACPGDYLYQRHGAIAAEVNRRLGVESQTDDHLPISYKVRITANALNIRSGPGTDYRIEGCITDHGVYTIVEERIGEGAQLWGRLKSGAGWISLDYCTKLG